MACPYFHPLTPMPLDVQPARAPLGVMHVGRCEQGGAGDGEACNFGYARGRCDFFPVQSGVDAVRFTSRNGKTFYILEKDFMPVEHGVAGELRNEAIRSQIEVFAAWANR